MTLCPIALAVGCKKCPAFGICPLKTVIGDYKPESAPAKADAQKPASAKAAPTRSSSAKAATGKAAAAKNRRGGKRSR
jgi:hypothetical protein